MSDTAPLPFFGAGHAGIGGYAVRLLIAIGVVALALLFWRIRDVLLLVFGAVLLAVLLRGLADWFERHLHLSAKWAMAVAVFLLLAIIGVSGWLMGREVSTQVDQLIRLVPDAWGKVRDYLQNHAWGRVLLEQTRGVDSLSEGVVSNAQSVVMMTVEAVGNLLLVAAGGIYFAVEPCLYRDGLVRLVPRSAEQRAREALDASGCALGQWLKGQMIAMATIGVLTTVGLWLLGVPSALALGLLAGLGEFVPLVGPIASAIPALLVASSEGGTTVLYVLGLYLVVQQVESNLITPLVERKLVSIPPALTLFAVVAMGLAFGVLGVLFATPLTVVAFVLVRKLYVQAALRKEG